MARRKTNSRKWNKKRETSDSEKPVSKRKQTAEALKEAVGWMFFHYRYAITYEMGIQLWGRRRADVIGNKVSGDLVMIEVKSSVADFRTDTKWTEYLPYTDRFYLAFTRETAKKIQDNEELMSRIPKRVGILVLGTDGYMKTAKSARRVPVEDDVRISVLARLAWRAGDLSKRTVRQRKRVALP